MSLSLSPGVGEPEAEVDSGEKGSENTSLKSRFGVVTMQTLGFSCPRSTGAKFESGVGSRCSIT